MNSETGTRHKLILMISTVAMEHEVEKVSKQIAGMLRARVFHSPREMESLLQDVEKGIRDNLYLSTRLTREDLEWLLDENLGSLRHCVTIQWLNE